MARKERNDIDYFPHAVNHGKKMFYLRDKFGNDGYAVWFMLLEHLGKANYHYLDLKDEVELMYLSSELKVSEITLKEIINCLVRFGDFDKNLWEEECILFNEKFVENISDAYRKRNNNCIDKISLGHLLESKGRKKPSKGRKKPSKSNSEGGRNPQTKVNYTKEKERRGAEFKNSLQPFLDLYGKDMLNNFYSYWTESNEKGKKMRFEMEKIFDLKKRLVTWNKNEKNFKPKNQNNGTGKSRTEKFLSNR